MQEKNLVSRVLKIEICIPLPSIKSKGLQLFYDMVLLKKLNTIVRPDRFPPGSTVTFEMSSEN